MSEIVRIYEVGPRDGLQNEERAIPTARKLRLIDRLVEAGLATIELTSFVHPRAVPQMADAEEVMATTLARHGDRPVAFVGLVLNERGYDRALASGCKRMAFGVAVSDVFSQNNTRNTAREAMETCRRLVARARTDGIHTRVYVMTAWVCPFSGPTAPERAIGFAREIWEMGIDEIAIADTIGYAHPLEVGRLFEAIGRFIPPERMAAHLHDTQALGLANSAAAISAGVRTIDSSIGGLGGCPFAPGAAGNLATEDLAFMLYKMGLGTGVDLAVLWDIVRDMEQLIGRSLGGRIRAWWESSAAHAPEVRQP